MSAHTAAATAAPPWAQQCPLCHQPNQCALAQGHAPENCWCMHTDVAPAALAQLPIAEQGQRCICPTCASPPQSATFGY